jgi:hypothetical protein
LKVLCNAFGLGLLMAVSLFSPSQAWAQKIIHISSGNAVVVISNSRSRRFARVHHRRFKHKRHFRKAGLPHLHLSTFSFPDQTLFPPYYASPQPWARGPDMASRIGGGRTVEQGSIWGSHIEGGKTVEQGSIWRGHISGGRTVEGGSRFASHIIAGPTVEGGSRWGSTMPNWRFTGYAAPMRPRGIPYYRASRHARSPWASRLR